jgi:hypothetical protein
MALAAAVQGATRPSQVITWTRADGTAEDLTGATITGTIKDSAGTVRAITGTLTVTTAASGVFTWAYSSADVATDGNYTVQFTAAFGGVPTPARTIKTPWVVYAAQTVSA